MAIELGVSPQTLDPIRGMAYPQAVEALKVLQANARVRYKQLLVKYHPDHNPDDPEGASLRTRALVQAYEAVRALQVQSPEPEATVRWSYRPAPEAPPSWVETRWGKRSVPPPRGPYDARKVIIIEFD